MEEKKITYGFLFSPREIILLLDLCSIVLRKYVCALPVAAIQSEGGGPCWAFLGLLERLVEASRVLTMDWWTLRKTENPDSERCRCRPIVLP